MNFFKGLIAVFMSMSIYSNCAGTQGVAPDENLKTMRLPNGLTVAVYENYEPPKRCSMRLLVKSGSLFETESERGLAHFIEHMAFNGTKHFPSGEMTEYFQRLGMAFGSDTNAHTSFVETVYKLELPEVSERVVDESLLLLRDYADGMLFEQSFIDSERSVILAEMNARDDAAYRKAVREIGLIFGGTKFGERMPIGLESVVKSATRDDFKKFYEQNYRPDNMVLVVVGDVSAADIFERAKKYFASFAAPNAPIRALDLGMLSAPDGGFGGDALSIKSDSTAVPNLPNSSASISFVREVGTDGLDSVEARAESDRLNLLGYVLNARFQRVADMAGSKILSGGASYYDYCAKMWVFSASCDAPLGDYKSAVGELFRQLASVRSISDVEVENAKRKIFELLQTAINGKSTRKNRSLANEIVSAYSDGMTFVSPEEDMRLTREAFEGCDAKTLVELFEKTVARSKVSLFISDSKCSSGAALDAEVKALYESARKVPYGSEIFAVSNLVYSDFGSQGVIESRKQLDKLGITQVKFANGVALNVKKTDFTKDEVLLNICIGSGVLSIPADRPEYYAAVPALILGGTKFQSAAEINAAVNLMKMSLGAKISNGSLVVSGSSNSRYCADMLRYAATVVADAGFRDDALPNLRNNAESFFKNYDANPAERLKFLSTLFVERGIAPIPGTFEAFKTRSMSDFAAWLRPILAKEYLEISVVGDVDVEEVVGIVSRTFGAMPKRDAFKPDDASRFVFRPAGSRVDQTYLATTEPISLACALWNTSFGRDMKKMRVATILSAVLDDVLRKDVRESEGNVYSPFAFYSNAVWLGDAGLTVAATFVEPSHNGELLVKLADCAKKLEKDVSVDEFERAKIPIIKSLKTAERNNRYWLYSVMSKSQAYPIFIEMAENREEFYKAVTLEEVRVLAREVFSQAPILYSLLPLKND